MPLNRNNRNANINPRTASNYVKNVGRSLGYAAVESLGNNAPALKALFSDNKDTVQSLYQEIKDFASSPLDKVKSNEKLMSYSNDIKTGFNNLMDDIKTGNLYNYDRQNSAMMSMMGFDDGDIFGDIDFDSDLESLDSNISAKANADIASAEVDAIDNIGSKVSASVSMATTKSAEYIVQANVQNTRAVLNQTTRIFNAVSTGLLGVNKTLGSIAQLAQPLTVHMQNSSVFYTESTKNQEKMIELLTTIAENTKRPEPKKGNKKEYFGIDAFLGADYSFNLSSMGSMIKKNAKNAFENSALGMFASMNDMFGEGSLIKMVTANPIGMAMPFLLDAMMTKKLKDSMKKLSDTMGAFNIKLIKDLNKLSRSSNPILSFIGELFNYDDKNKSKRDTGEYEKGAISFDGVTKHAIVRVIPEYLGMILAQLGGPNTRYDFKAGKFITKNDIRKQKEKAFNNEVENLAFEHTLEVDNMLSEKSITKAEAAQIKASIQKYVSNALKEGHYIDPNTSSDNYKEYGFKTKTQMDEVKKLISYYERTGQYGQIEMLNQQIREARNARIASINEDPYLSNEDYMLDNGFAMVSGGAYPVNSNGIRERRSTSSSKKNKSGSSKSDEPDSAELTRVVVGKLLIQKGYDTEDNLYKKFMEKFEKAVSLDDKEKLLKELKKVKEKKEETKEKKSGLAKLISQPMDFLADQMDKAAKALYTVMYGKEKDKDGNPKDNSIIGTIFTQMKDIFSSFKDFLKKDIMDPIKKYFEERGGLVKMITDFFGIDDPEGLKAFVKGKAKDLWTGVKGNLKSVGRWAWNNSPVVQGYRAYKGKKTAREAASDWMESLGSNFMPEGSGSGLRRLRGGATAKEVYDSGKKKVSDFFSEDTNGFGYQVGQEVFAGLKSFFSAIMPDKEKAEKETDTIGKFIKTSVKEIDPAGAVTGALLGGGVSLLTGGMISPMLAASLGAAAGITIKSEKVQNMLFGEVDEESGDRQGGLFNKELSNFITKQLPSIAAWGTTGGVLAMLPGVPGGPVTGIILGSALGFAKNNQTIQNFLWGEDENDVGILGTKKDQKDKIDWIKKMLPKAAAGAVIGAVAGPFGFTGNIIAGAALGFASETEIFKRTMFGEEEPVLDENGKPMKDDNGNIVYARNGGIAGWIKKDIVGPVASAIKPIASELKFRAKSIVRGMGRMIANVFKERVGTPIFARINEYLLKPFFKTIKKPAEFIGGVFTAPFRAIGAYGQHLKNKQISQGRADYMSAKERLAYRESLDYKRLGLDKSEDKYIEFDTALAGMDEDQLASIGQRLKEAQKVQKKNLHATNQKLQAIITYIQHGYGVKPADFFNKRLQKKDMTMTATIMAYNNSKAVQSGKFEAISDTDKPILQNMYEEYIDTQDLFLGSEGTTADALKELQEQLGLKGVNIKEGNIDRYLDMARAELKFRQSGTEAVKLDPEKVRNELIQAQTDKIHARLVDLANGVLSIGRMLDTGLFGGRFDGYLKPLEGSTADYNKNHPEGNVVEKSTVTTVSKEDQDFIEDFEESMAESRASGSRIGRYFAKGSRLRKMFGGAALVGAGSQFSLFGSLKTKIAKDGQEVVDTQDKESRATLKTKETFFNKFNDIADYVKNIFNRMPDEDAKEEEKKEKKGFLESIIEGITGEKGLLGGLASWFGGTSLGKWAGTFLAKLPSLPTIIAGAGGVALGALGLKFVSDSVKGKWDDVAHKLGWGALSAKTTDEDWSVGSNATVTSGTGVDASGNVKAVAYDENGEPVTDENGNYLATDGSVITNFKSNTGFTFGQKMLGNTARSLITGNGVALSSAKLIGKGLNKMSGGALARTVGGVGTNLGSKITTSIGSKIGTNILTKKAANAGIKASAKNIAAVAEKSAGNLLSGQIGEQIVKVFNGLKKLPILKNFAGALDDMAAGLSQTVSKQLAGKSAQEVGKAVLGFAAFAAKLALIAIDFEEGYNHAQRTLGIKEPTVPQKILSGIIRVVKNLIPIVGTLIPDKIVVDLFVKIIAPFVGMDTSEFMKQREDFEAEAAEAGMSVEDYVQSVGQQEGWGEATWGEKIVSGAKTVGTKVANSKLGKAVSSSISKIGSDAKEAFTSIQPAIDAIMKSSVDLGKLSVAGDIKGIFDYNPMSQFENADENPLAGIAHGTIFVSKMFHFIPGAISWVGHKIFGAIKDKVDIIKTDASAFLSDVGKLNDSVAATEGTGLLAKIKNIWTTKTSTYNSMLSGLFNVIFTIGKVLYTVISAVSIITQPLQKFVEGVKEKASGIVEGVTNKVSEVASSAKEWFDDTAVGKVWNHLWNGAGSFVSQLDPRVAKRKFGSSTIGDNGCAPSVASMLTGYDLSTTAGMATKGGYANSRGTSADYFGRVLGSAGIPAEYVYTGAGSAQDYLAGKIASGSPTVLLGRDPYNTSKAYSPFGPGNHYVLATGMTKNGGVVVQDPESSRPNMVYDKSILNSVKLGIPTGGRSGLRKARRFRGGRAVMGLDTSGTSGTVASANAETTNKYVDQTVENCARANLGSFSMPSVTELNAWINKKRPDSPFNGNAAIFIKASKESGLDPRYILAHAAVESGWGTSNQALNKRNYFGIGSFDTNPSNAYTMGSSMEIGIVEGAKWIARNYYHGKYNQTCVYKMRYNDGVHQYCTSDTWVGSIAQLMSSMPKNTKLSLVEGIVSTITGGLSNGESAQEDASAESVAGKSGKSGGIVSGIMSLGSMFGKLFSSAFGKLGSLFGFSYDDESSEENSTEGVTGEENVFNTDTSSSEYKTGVVGSRSSNNFPYYNQGSEPWGSMMYSATNNKSQTIKSSGCGPTSMAMVLQSYKKNYDPSTAAQYSLSNGFRTSNSGTSWGYFNSLGAREGLTVDQFSDPSKVSGYLSKNIPVIASMGPGYFTKGGHYVVLSGMKDGNLLVNDPASQDRTNKIWDMSSSLSQGKQFWAISNDGVGSIGATSGSTISASRQKELEQAAVSGAYVGQGSGLVGNYNIARDAYNVTHRKHHSSNSVFGAGSKIVNLSGYSNTRKAKYVSNLISNMRAGGSTNDEVLIALLKAMITLLSNMSTNSDKINAALGSIGSLIESRSMSGSSGNMNLNQAREGINVADTDSTLAELQSLLNSIASGD